MTQLTFGRDTRCFACHQYHPQGSPCGPALRDEGMARVASVSATWIARASSWVVSQPRGSRFTAETMTAQIGRPERVNAVGAVLSGLKKKGLIRDVGYETAKRAERHASRSLVWERVG